VLHGFKFSVLAVIEYTIFPVKPLKELIGGPNET